MTVNFSVSGRSARDGHMQPFGQPDSDILSWVWEMFHKQIACISNSEILDYDMEIMLFFQQQLTKYVYRSHVLGFFSSSISAIWIELRAKVPHNNANAKLTIIPVNNKCILYQRDKNEVYT